MSAPAPPPPGRVDLGDLLRTEPFSRDHGYDRGTPVDRWFLERFLGGQAEDIRGSVLEVQNPGYARRFGAERVERVEVLDIDPENPHATLIADLQRPDSLPSAHFDCFICTQTLQFVFDLPAAIRSAHRLLRPGGTLLLSVPAISYLDPYHSERCGEYWHFTAASVRRLLETRFAADPISIASHGNVLAAIGFLAGLAAEELPAEAFRAPDPRYPVLITARCRKS